MKKFVLAFTLILLLTGGMMAHAATKTSAYFKAGPSEALVCVVQNLGTTMTPVTIEIRASDGSLTVIEQVNVGPGQRISSVQGLWNGFPGYCVFKYTGKSDIRGYILLLDTSLAKTTLVEEAH